MIMELAGYLLSDAMAAALFLIAVSIGYRLFLARSGRPGLNRILIMAALIVAPLILPLSMLCGEIASNTPIAEDGQIVVVGVGSYPRWLVTVIRIYAAGVAAVLLFQLIGHILSVILLAGAERKITPWGKVMVSRRKNLVPFCWMGYVVTGSDETDKYYGMILTHEQIHVTQRHWLDLLIAGVVAAVNWFNPAVWWLFGQLKRVHEFQADRGVLRSGADEYEYQMLLIRRTAPRLFRYVNHNFTDSALRSRIEMMNNPSGNRRHGLRIALLAAAGIITALTAAGNKTLTKALDSVRYAAQNAAIVSGSVAVPTDPEGPVIIVDGKVVDKETMDRIDPKTIDHVTVNRMNKPHREIIIELKK